MGIAQQSLSWNAAPKQAGPAVPRVLFDDSGLQTELTGADRRDVSSWSSPDDRYIKRRLFFQDLTLYSSENVEVFFLEKRIGLHDNVLLRPVFHFVQRNELTALQSLGDVRIDAHGDLFTVKKVCHLFNLLLDIVADRFWRLRPTRPSAVRAWPA